MTVYELGCYCTRMEEKRPLFSRRIMEKLSVRHRKFKWQMRPNTQILTTQDEIGIPKRYKQVETSVWRN